MNWRTLLSGRPLLLALLLLLLISTSAGDLDIPDDCRGAERPVRLRIGLWGEPTTLPGHADAPSEERLPSCEVAWVGHAELESALKVAEDDAEAVVDALSLDFLLTNSLQAVPFSGRHGRLAFLEGIKAPATPEDVDGSLLGKTRLLSVLLPAASSSAMETPYMQLVARQAMAVMPQHIFFDDGTPEVYEKAFGEYRFSLIADSKNHTVSQAFVHCIALQCVPLFNGFASLGAMTLRAVVPFNSTHFNLPAVLETLEDINYDVGWLWNYHRMLQDQLYYRYASTFEARFASVACSLCRLGRPAADPSQGPPLVHVGGESASLMPTAPPLVFVGVYSAKANFDRRAAVRETWGRVLREAYGLRVRFFLGRVSPLPSQNDERVRREAAEHGDIVALDVEEGYKMNSRKGVLFLEWCAANVFAEFLLKVDDDIHLRPAPLLHLLHRRLPAGYVWGYFDFLSPVPTNEDSPFFNSEEAYPFHAFPPYARGLVRVLSMDVVRGIAALSSRGRLRMVFGDDPCFGVHLRQLLLDEEAPAPFLALDDRDSYRVFAMEPSCNPSLWSYVTPRSWVVHHVTAQQLRCMWRADMAAGLYESDANGSPRPTAQALQDAAVAASISTAVPGSAPAIPALPNLCECLATGPLAEELAARQDKINASRTYAMWGDPNSADL